MANNILSLGGSDGIAKVLKKDDNLLASRWGHGIHLNQGGECTDEWEEGRTLLHGSGADLHSHVLKLTHLEQGRASSSRGEASKKPDGLITSINGLGVITLSDLKGGGFSGHHLLMVGNSLSESLSLIHIFFNLTIKVI